MDGRSPFSLYRNFVSRMMKCSARGALRRKETRSGPAQRKNLAEQDSFYIRKVPGMVLSHESFRAGFPETGVSAGVF